MKQQPDAKIVFSIRTNFGSIKNSIAIEDGSLDKFEQHIDSIFKVLLEIEMAQ